ncbi:hypothetical protein H5410_041523 [Solanum commersonii]|uniref:Uncharacterized protein n=1 Tax=Solanum commersonii TaxID=4109 RepID=A0A9J5XS39_SOLCO|nr:hypothetical protein H5410_041523 [Solanum commersonii]
MFNLEETCVEIYLHLSRIYSELKDVHHIYSTFKSGEICVERYLHLSHIYSKVKDVDPMVSPFIIFRSLLHPDLTPNHLRSPLFAGRNNRSSNTKTPSKNGIFGSKSLLRGTTNQI